MLSMATQLGMNSFIPLLCDYSVTRYDEKMHDRWQRIILSASKQCRQCYFPEIQSGRGLSEIIFQQGEDTVLIVGDHQGQSAIPLFSRIEPNTKQVVFLIGPEGGFSDEELALMESQNVLKLRLSSQILRTEAAAVSMLSVINQIFKK